MQSIMYHMVGRSQSDGLHQKPCTTENILQQVMSGAMGVCCMRSGVWVSCLSRTIPMQRCVDLDDMEVALSVLILFLLVGDREGGLGLPPSSPTWLPKSSL